MDACGTYISQHTPFDGLGIDPCANHVSVTIIGQYLAYCQTFNLPISINTFHNRTTAYIGGSGSDNEVVIIHVPFTELRAVIDVVFSSWKKIPTLLSMKDLSNNSLDISIQEICVTL